MLKKYALLLVSMQSCIYTQQIYTIFELQQRPTYGFYNLQKKRVNTLSQMFKNPKKYNLSNHEFLSVVGALSMQRLDSEI